MKTLADLKRDLKVGTKIKCLKHSLRAERVGEVSTIEKVQTNGIKQNNGRFLDIPSASLVVYENNVFSMYNVGLRDLTEWEQEMYNRLHNVCSKEQQEIDMLTDGSQCYYTEKRFAKDNDIEYLLGFDMIKGLKYDFNTGKMYDNKVKGTLLYSFEILEEDFKNEIK